jgi:flagellar protein FlgJ
MEQEFFEVFPTMLGLHGTDEILSQGMEGVPTRTGDKRTDFVINYYGAAERIGKKFGINPIVILAQAAIESGWGTSTLARLHNNFFGVTAYGQTNDYWKGKKYISKSSGLPFRSYPNSTDGFSDFARLISSKYSAAAKASESVTEYARLISSSPYINEKNGDNRAKYKELIIRNSIAINLILKKYQSLHN